MKAERLLAITMLLLHRECVSAPELAKRFAVSARTIYRDVESLCEAGIPIVAYPGSGGGYGIMSDFKIDRSLVRPGEIGQISAALASISAAIGDTRMGQTIDRLEALRARSRNAEGPRSRADIVPLRPTRDAADRDLAAPENYLFIELAPAARVREKIGKLRQAIEERRPVRFGYVDAEGRKSSRSAEPAALVFTWQAWYVYAFCRSRGDFRLFKIARIAELELLPERFSPRAVDLDERPWNKGWEESSPFLAARIRFFEASRVEEHFSAESIELEPEGSAIVTTALPADEWAVSYLLGLGVHFEVLEPEALRRLVAERASAILERNT
jgi:predicted DNA-binding transcriptional regulator YafY